MNEFSEFVQWGFYSVLTGCAIYLTSILNGLKGSVDELNVKMATIIEKTSNHEKRIEKLEDKLH
jgi:hypothetical protein